MDEQLPLHDDQASGAENLLDRPRQPMLGAWQIILVSGTLVLACMAALTISPKISPMMQLPSRDVSSRVFLSDVIVAQTSDKEGDEPNGKASGTRDSNPNKESAASAADDAAAKAKSLAAAEQLNARAKSLEQHSESLKSSADDLQAAAQKLRKQVTGAQDDASRDREAAEKARRDAEKSRARAEETLKNAKEKAAEVEAKAEREATELLTKARRSVLELNKKAETKAANLNQKAGNFDNDASAFDQGANKKESTAADEEKRAKGWSQKADSMGASARTERQHAIDAETEARRSVAAQRMCIGLPGVKLKGNSPGKFAPVVGDREFKDDWQCNDWCLKHAECKQSVFIWETKTCELYKEATAEPQYFRETWPWFNSSYCGTIGEKEAMLDMLHKVYDAKPWVPPPHNCSWAGDNCIETKCCADYCDANFDFTTCKPFTCYKRDENWAGCRRSVPDESWDGTKLGGHPNGEVAPAPDGKLLQGTRLYCFSVVMWNQPAAEAWQDSEADLANHWKKEKKGIMQCDDWSIFDGFEGGSVHNIQSFIHAWKLVKDDGRWKQNDWSIKVDPDAVFFPDHFRKKLVWQYKTPQGSAVYMRNTFFEFQFLGGLEALTREALEIYLTNGWQCETHLGQEGGEDYWMLQCFEGIGIDYQSDFTLLHDKYAADENCFDPNSVFSDFLV